MCSIFAKLLGSPLTTAGFVFQELIKVLLIIAIADATSAIQAAEWRSSASTSSSASATTVQSYSSPASPSHDRQQPKKVLLMAVKATLNRFDFQGYCQRPLAALEEETQWKKMQGTA